MCLSKAYLNGTSDTPVMEDIARITATPGTVVLRSLFGESTEVTARIEEVDFTENTVWLQPV
jgi:predicted RNA-binding protein